MNFSQYNPYQQWGTMQPQQPVQQQEPPQNIICRPVASIEEARAIQTDFSGALMVFPDISHGAIHTKRLDFSTGSAVFNTYFLKAPNLESPENAPVETVQYATVDDVNAISDKLKCLESMITEKPKPATKGAAEK